MVALSTRSRTRRRGALGTLVIVFAALLFGSGIGQPSMQAHAANLVSSDPPDHALVTTEPGAVTLTFDGRVLGSPTSAIAVTLSGRSVVTGALSVDTDTGTTLTARLRPGSGPGLYQVSWHASDFDDGTYTTGFLSFIVGPVSPAPPATAVTAPDGTIGTLAPNTMLSAGDGNGDGWATFADVAGGRQVQIFLENATPSMTYTVQLCDPLLVTCTAIDPTRSITTSDTGLVLATVLVPQAAPGAGLLLISTADPNEIYQAQPLTAPQSPTVPNLPDLPDVGP